MRKGTERLEWERQFQDINGTEKCETSMRWANVRHLWDKQMLDISDTC